MRPVEWVRHLADQAVDRVARQPRVGVERYDVADAGGHAWGLPTDAEKARVGRATQQPVQFMQLAALAFPADPSRFAGVPEPLAVQQQEAVATRCRAVAPIEPGDAGSPPFPAATHRLRHAVSPHRASRREERNAVRLPGSQGDAPPDARSVPRSPRASSAAWARRPSCANPRHATAKFKRRQQRCTEAACHTAVHHRHRRVDGRHHAQETEQGKPHRAQTLGVQHEQRHGEEDRGAKGAGADIDADSEPPGHVSGPGGIVSRKPMAASNAGRPPARR